MACARSARRELRAVPGPGRHAGTKHTRGGTEAPPGPGTLPLWRWWLAPLAAGVAAVTLWMVVPEQQRVAEAPPQRKKFSRLCASRRRAGADAAAPPASERLQNNSPSARRPQPRPSASPATSRCARTSSRHRRRRRVRAEDGRSWPTKLSRRSSPPPAARPRTQRGRALEESRRAANERASQRRPLRSPRCDPSLGWRIVGDRIERSDNGGKTWTVERQTADGDRRGSAPSNSVGLVRRARGARAAHDRRPGHVHRRSASPSRSISRVSPPPTRRSAMVFSVVGPPLPHRRRRPHLAAVLGPQKAQTVTGHATGLKSRTLQENPSLTVLSERADHRPAFKERFPDVRTHFAHRRSRGRRPRSRAARRALAVRRRRTRRPRRR